MSSHYLINNHVQRTPLADRSADSKWVPKGTDKIKRA